MTSALIKTDPFVLIKNNPHDAQIFVDESPLTNILSMWRAV
jgi:hypothetical protein